MDKSKFNCVEYFPKILGSYHDKIINTIYQNRESATYSHKTNGRWENQYLNIQYFPENTECLDIDFPISHLFYENMWHSPYFDKWC